MAKRPIPKFEIILNGEIAKTVSGWEDLETDMELNKSRLESAGFEFVRGESGGSNGYNVYFRAIDLKSATYGWRMLTPFVDKHGNIIYDGDDIKHEYGPDNDIRTLAAYHTFSDDDYKGYYVRRDGAGNVKHPITAEEIKEYYVVCHKVFPGILPKNEPDNRKKAVVDGIVACLNNACVSLGVPYDESLREMILQRFDDIKET